MFDNWTKNERIGGAVVVGLVGIAAYLLVSKSAKAAERLPATEPQVNALPQGGTVTTLPEVTVTADGSGPAPTWKGPLPPSPESYRTGLTTAWIQTFLMALSQLEKNVDLNPRSASGVWDGPTALAVMAYQADRRLTVDAKVGPATAKAMNADYARYASQIQAA